MPGKILVIGSAVADVMIELEDHLPVTGEDVHVRSQQMRMGGCAFNTYHMIRHFGLDTVPFFPVGQGAYGEFVLSELLRMDIQTPIPRPSAHNGCCYCFIEAGGERTFISYHGAEYRFEPEWFDLIDPSDIESVYVCGIEIEEPTGPVIVRFLEENPRLKVFFSPGPRLTRIEPALLDRIFALHPVLHLNETEVCQAAFQKEQNPSPDQPQEETVRTAARILSEKTGNAVIVTLGEKGCYYTAGCPNKAVTCPGGGSGEGFIPPFPACQIDTVGAGDSHIGAVMACLALGYDMPRALAAANRISSAVVEKRGALLTDEEFQSIMGGRPR